MMMKYLQNYPEEVEEISLITSTFSSLDFSGLDLSSSIGFFSDDDDDDDVDDDDEESSSYIEIALNDHEPQTCMTLVQPQLLGDNQQKEAEAEEKSATATAGGSTDDQDDDDDDDDDEKELEFGISFSSDLVSTFSGFPTLSSTTITTTASTSSSNSSEFSAAAGGYAIKVSAESPPPMPAITKESSHPISHHDDNDQEMALNTMANSWKVVRSRKTAKPLTAAVNNGGVLMQLLIKFQSISIRPVVTSLMKLKTHGKQQVISSRVVSNSTATNATTHQNKSSNSRNYKVRLKNCRRRLIKPFGRWTSAAQRKNQMHGDHQSHNSNSSCITNMNKKYYSDNSIICNGNGDHHQRSARVTELTNLDTIRAVLLDSLRVLNIGRKDKQKISTSKSCPTSVKSSPLIHGVGRGGQGLVPSARSIHSTRENCVQEAIAHCKSSFGQT